MKEIDRLNPALPNPVVGRRSSSSGGTVRLIYASSIFVLAMYLSWYFGRIFVYLEGPGIVESEKSSVSVPYVANIKAIDVAPGAAVKKGQSLAVVFAPEMHREISRLTEEIGNFEQKEDELKIKIAVHNSVRDVLQLRGDETSRAKKKLLESKEASLATLYKLDVLKEAASASQAIAQFEEESKKAEARLKTLQKSKLKLEQQLASLLKEYNDGVLTSPMSGVIGPHIAHVGDTVVPGQNIAEVFDPKENFIKWLAPYHNFKNPTVGERVYVLYGNFYLKGRVVSIKSLADMVENKKGPSLHEPEQGQVAKVVLEDENSRIPIGAQVSVRLLYFRSLDHLYDIVSAMFKTDRLK